MKKINDFINEGIFRRGTGLAITDRLKKFGFDLNSWGQLGVTGQGAVTILVRALDYISDNPEVFADYKDTANAVRDAVNNSLEQGNYNEKLEVIK